MKSFRVILFALLISFVGNVFSQNNIKELKKIKPKEAYENIHVIPLHSDTNASSYLIFVKKEVKSHKHIFHTEHVQVISGKGIMKLGNEVKIIKEGDLIIIPKNTPHSVIVKGKKPLVVLSVQAPKFNGKDRVFIED